MAVHQKTLSGDLYTWLTVAVIALVTAAIRFFPFIAFSGSRPVPPLLRRLGRVLPHAVMGMLVVYCLKDINFTHNSGFLPMFLACMIVGLLHIWKRNTLLSILCGTICYMVMVQMIF